VTAIDLTNIAEDLFQLQEDGMQELWTPASTFLAEVPKKTNWEGEHWELPGIYDGIRGSATFSVAQAGKSAPKLYKFLVDKAKNYVIGSIDCMTLKATASNRGAHVEALSLALKAAMEEFGKTMACLAWGNGGGSRGRGASLPAATTLRLVDRSQLRHFSIGMEIQSSATDGLTGAVRPGTATILGMDDALGDLYTDVAFATQITGFVATDFLFREGDFAGAPGVGITGVTGWCPATAPVYGGGDLFWGVNRGLCTPKLAGQRVVGAGGVIFDALARARDWGGKPDRLYVPSAVWAELQKNMHSKAWVSIPVPTKINGLTFRGISIPGPAGDVTALCDPAMPYDIGFLTRLDSWEFKSLGEAPHLCDEDGKTVRVEPSNDAVEFRDRVYGNWGCKRQVDNVHITW